MNKDRKLTTFIIKAAIVETTIMCKHKDIGAAVHMGSKKETGESVSTALN